MRTIKGWRQFSVSGVCCLRGVVAPAQGLGFLYRAVTATGSAECRARGPTSSPPLFAPRFPAEGEGPELCCGAWVWGELRQLRRKEAPATSAVSAWRRCVCVWAGGHLEVTDLFTCKTRTSEGYKNYSLLGGPQVAFHWASSGQWLCLCHFLYAEELPFAHSLWLPSVALLWDFLARRSGFDLTLTLRE